MSFDHLDNAFDRIALYWNCVCPLKYDVLESYYGSFDQTTDIEINTVGLPNLSFELVATGKWLRRLIEIIYSSSSPEHKVGSSLITGLV